MENLDNPFEKFKNLAEKQKIENKKGNFFYSDYKERIILPLHETIQKKVEELVDIGFKFECGLTDYLESEYAVDEMGYNLVQEWVDKIYIYFHISDENDNNDYYFSEIYYRKGEEHIDIQYGWGGRAICGNRVFAAI